ncbi:MAG: peptidylprolyl isomerase [Bacteroidetes bacterium]|nr:peptidylprolyl isomerase [Bacteroidota bacterium]MBS1755921.1 peptidylprolyl isomerase [Bacteroidota bacterium]
MADTTLTTGTIQTNKGNFTFELFDDATPIAAANFKKLASEGYYDGVLFHRVIPNFMVQTGDPTGTGAGGPGYTINCETGADKQYHDRGIMSMAHRGKNTGGSQFFICHNRQGTQHLDGVHTCFGKITSGLEFLDDIKAGDKMIKVTID